MPRQAHKRGVKGSRSNKNEKRKRGISREQVCVLCAMDRTGNIMTELICKGGVRYTDLEMLFKNRIEENSILCTDSHKSYIKFAKDFGLELQQIKRGKHREEIYHIQHINAFHRNLKAWMDKFRGVATKYLANYMYWFKWLQFLNDEKDTVKSKHLMVQSHASYSNTKIKDFKTRETIYV